MFLNQPAARLKAFGDACGIGQEPEASASKHRRGISDKLFNAGLNRFHHQVFKGKPAYDDTSAFARGKDDGRTTDLKMG